MLWLILIYSVLVGFSIGMMGMGGVFLTPALILIMDLSLSEIMGTVLLSFTATGMMGSLMYHRRGNINWSAALLLGSFSALGSIFGASTNLALDEEILKTILGLFLAAIGVFTLLRHKFSLPVNGFNNIESKVLPVIIFSLTGIIVGFASGLLGVGGPVLLVPLLVAAGWPILLAVGVSQVVSVFASLAGAAGYLQAGNLSFLLALWLAGGQLIGVVCGSISAHSLPENKIKILLGTALIFLGFYFAA